MTRLILLIFHGAIYRYSAK